MASSDWTERLYELSESDENGVLDSIYDRFDYLCEHDLLGCERLLIQIDPLKLSASAIIGILIGTLPVKNYLLSRPDFIERSLPVLSQEPEPLEEVLQGLR